MPKAVKVSKKLASLIIFLPSVAFAEADVSSIKKQILNRCKENHSSSGMSIVKVCADEDLKAFKSVSNYPTKHFKMVKRCMNNHLDRAGWSIVKVCVDEDIKAAKELENF